MHHDVELGVMKSGVRQKEQLQNYANLVLPAADVSIQSDFDMLVSLVRDDLYMLEILVEHGDSLVVILSRQLSPRTQCLSWLARSSCGCRTRTLP